MSSNFRVEQEKQSWLGNLWNWALNLLEIIDNSVPIPRLIFAFWIVILVSDSMKVSFYIELVQLINFKGGEFWEIYIRNMILVWLIYIPYYVAVYSTFPISFPTIILFVIIFSTDCNAWGWIGGYPLNCLADEFEGTGANDLIDTFRLRFP